MSFLVSIVMSSTRVTGQDTTAQRMKTQDVRFQYAAKFLCTLNLPPSPPTTFVTPSVVPGLYKTVVSIHNPHNRTVVLREKIAITVGPAIRVSQFVHDQL